MHANRPTRRVSATRAIDLLGLSACLVTAFGLGGWIDPWNRGALESPQPGRTKESRDYVAPTGDPRPALRLPQYPPQPEPRAVEARENVIQRDSAAILAECQRSAGGDWDRWQRETAWYRTNLKARIDALPDFPETRFPVPEGGYEPLAGRGGFPLFEVASRAHLNYLYDPGTMDKFRQDRQVIAADRWLRQRGIDLIFVPVPKMTEIYIEHFLDSTPPDGIIAPHMRHALLELFDAHVEVVDGFSLFRALRDTDTEYLYNTADTHWAPRGMRIMAKEIADRIERYKFGARARYAPPVVRTSLGPYITDRFPGGGQWLVLSPEQRTLAQGAQTTNLSEVSMLDGSAPPDDLTSPVIVIGHSYVPRFREQLIKELNLLIYPRVRDGETTGFFGEFLREPEVLNHCRVVVWITTEQHLTHFQKMPEPIMAALQAER
jgi:hypothetical protein